MSNEQPATPTTPHKLSEQELAAIGYFLFVHWSTNLVLSTPTGAPYYHWSMDGGIFGPFNTAEEADKWNP